MAERMTGSPVPARKQGLEHLGAHVAGSLEGARLATDAGSRVRARLARGEAPLPRAPRAGLRVKRSAIASVLAIAAAVLLLVLAPWKSERRALTFVIAAPGANAESGVVGAFLAAPPTAELPIAFSDGTSIRVAAGASARVAEVTPRGARVLVESGVVHANVVHRADTQWLVDAGPFEVKVTGTRFDVAWQPTEQAVVVTLHEGSVVVSGCGLAEGQRVSSGQELRASCKSGTLGPVSALPSPFPTSLEPATTAASALPDAPPVPAPAPAPASALASASDLLARANADRYAARFDAATVSLDTVRRRFPGSDAAATAAFELGRIAFDGRHDFATAADWFDTYLGERPAGALAREALGRAIEARHRAGANARARELAARYLAAYPNGPHASLARRLEAQAPSGEVSDEPPGAAP